MINILVALIGSLPSLIAVVISHKSNKKNYNKATQCLLRNDIVNFYQIHKQEKKMTMYEFQAIETSYDQYHTMGGNHFVDELMEEIKTWEKV